ncbi:conserved hypothetical protein [Aspergillus terreus NIH2624]|uniref:Uncharacterized protein n=1 Tax=Aspergillus terreus (strain NIH 2624 / FGSC A1156) TaxID=341663 RepID=Q0CI51_ASPTN|nr:uncharacterized protein ATEG_06633 [Aspergillus terreus NIH2624]EAU33177.1 conserved hypothetical protein [Aspergillus terreus NIH2624]
MRAARFYAGRDVRIEEVKPPVPSEDKVLISVEWCGICGSDLNEYIRGPMAIPSEKTGPHPLTGDVLPVTMGHEFTGRVVHAPASSSLRPGQGVVVDPRYFCASCIPCSKLSTNCCDTIGFMGISGGGGGLSEMVAVAPEKVYPLPDDADLAAAALIEPLTVAWHSLRLSGIDDFKDTPVLVVGAGPVGVAVVFALRARGANAIFVSEPSQKRREFLADITHAVFDPTETDLGKKCRELTELRVGFQTGLDALRFQGQHINLAVPKTPLTLPWYLVMRREAVLKSSLAYDETDFKEVVEAYVEGRFQGVERMITRRIPLEEVVAKGFEELCKPNDQIKILATPTTR